MERKGRFTMFTQLPKEIRLQIWKLALADPWLIASSFGGILVIVNFELARQRVIILAPQDHPYGLDFVGDEHDRDANVRVWKKLVFNTSHACHKSRTVTFENYCLDLKSIIPEENIPWWGEDDVVFFPTDPENGHTLEWMSQKRPGRLHYLPSIHHLALDVSHRLFEALGYLDHNIGEMPDVEAILPPQMPGSDWQFAWPTNFPCLETMFLVFDPGEIIRFRRTGTVKLYAAKDVVVRDLGSLKPSQIEERAARRLVEFAQLEEPNGDPHHDFMPVVECSVMCWKKPKARRA